MNTRMGIRQRIGRLAAAVVLAGTATVATSVVAAEPAYAGQWIFGGDYFTMDECEGNGAWGVELGEWTNWYCQGPIHGFYFLWAWVP